MSGLIFASLFLKFQDVLFSSVPIFILTFTFYALAFSLLLVIAAYDVRHKIIPDTLSFALGALAFLGLFLFSTDSSPVFYPHVPTLLEFFSGILIAFPFALFWLISGGRWMGFGDAKLALGIGWLLGLSSALSGLVLAFWSGAVIGVTLVILSKKIKGHKLGMKSEIPFAPFLVLGAFLAFIFELNLFNF